MPRRPTTKLRGQIWLPREGSITHNIKVNSVVVKTDVISSDWTKGLCPEIGSFRIKLIDSDNSYTDKFSLGQVAQLFADFATGTTEIFEGTIDTISKVYDNSLGFIVEVNGSHLTKELQDVNVTESYNKTLTIEEIIDVLNANYLTGFTVSYTATSTKKPKINWDEKPLWECIFDLTKLADADCRVSDSKVIEFFDKNSIANDVDRIVWNDTLITLKGLGQQTITTKNKIKVIGDDGTGIPVLYTSDDTLSQGNYGIKELALFNTKITTPAQAEEVGDAERDLQSTPADEGEATSLLLPSLDVGQKIWISDPPLKINGQFKVYKFTHNLPSERTNVVIGKERRLPQIFKKRVENELATQTITNPYKMKKSWNFKFDNFGELSTWDTNVSISEGKIKLSSGSQGVFTSLTNRQAADVTEIHLLVVGSNIVGTNFQLSTEGGSDLETITPNERKTLTNPGKDLVLRVTLQSANTEIDSIGVLFL